MSDKVKGSLMMIVCVAVYALLTPMLKKVDSKVAPFAIMTVSMFSLFITSLLFSVFYEKSFSWKLFEDKSSVLILLLVGVINAFGFWLSILVFKYMPAWQQSLFNILTPIFVAIFSYFILRESCSPKILISLLLMGAGLYISLK